MEKLSLEEFQKLKNRAEEVYQIFIPYLTEEIGLSDIPEEEAEALEEKFDGLQKQIEADIATLKQSDLSDIPFEEWKDFRWLTQQIDLEGTGANIDLSQIYFFELYDPVRLKGCNIRNFDFQKYLFDEDSFDNEFREAHSEYFVGERITNPEAKKRYYQRGCTIEDIVEYQLLDSEIDRVSRYQRALIEQLGMAQVRTMNLELVKGLSYYLNEWIKEGSLGTVENTLGATGEEKDINELIASRVRYDIEFGDNLYRYDMYMQIPYLQEHLPEHIIDFDLPPIDRNDILAGRGQLTPEQSLREHLLSNYKSRYLKLNDVLNNYDIFRGKRYANSLAENDRHYTEEQIEEFYKEYGELLSTIKHLGVDYSKIIDSAAEGKEALAETLKKSVENARRNNVDQMSIRDVYVLSKYCPEWEYLNIPNKDFLHEVFIKYTPEEIMKFEDISLTNLETSDLNQIREYGNIFGNFDFINTDMRIIVERFSIDSIIALDDEYQGMISDFIKERGEQISGILRNTYGSRYRLSDDKSLEEVDKAIKNILIDIDRRGDFTYEKYRGALEKKHPEMFLSENAPDELAKKFYQKRLTFKDFRDHPEWQEYLKETDLSLGTRSVSGYVSLNTGYSEYMNIVQYFEEKYPKEDVMKFLTDFDVIFDNPNITLRNVQLEEGMPWEQVKDIYYKGIENLIRSVASYSDRFPDDFKQRYPDLFLSEAIPLEVREKVYSGSITLDDIRNVPGLYEELKTKDTRGIMYKLLAQKSNLSMIDTAVGRENFLGLAQKYGYYLENCGINIPYNYMYNTEMSLEDKLAEIEKQIQDTIREKINNGQLNFGPDAPDFIKQERPELFLADDAPEVLKLSYYSKYTSSHPDYDNHSSSNYTITFRGLELHPEWVPYLRGKDLGMTAYTKERNVHKTFDIDTVMKFIKIDISALEVIAESNAVNRFLEFYNERSQYFAWKEMKDLEGIPAEDMAPAVLGGEVVTPEQIKAKEMFDKKVEKFKVEILRNPGVFLDYPEDKLSEFNFGEYRDLKRMSGFKNSDDYRRDMEENIIAHMYGFLGYGEAKQMLQLPNLSQEEIGRIYEEQRTSFEAVYEKRFKLKGNVKVLNSFFEKFEPTLPGGKPRLEIYKAFNQKLEEGYEGDLESLLLECFEAAKVKPPMDKIKLCSENVDAIHTAEKMSFARDEMFAKINAYVQENPADKKILFDNLFAAMKDSLSKTHTLDKTIIEQYLKEEFARVKEDGSSFYSEHVTEHIPELMRIIDDFNNTPEIANVMNTSSVDLIKTEKEKIGNNWIRKARTISDNLTLEQLDELEAKLYGESGHSIDFVKHVELKDKSEQGRKDAYELLKQDANPMLLTYEKAEKMFNQLTGPYSKAFAEFFIKHKEEFMAEPKYYTILKKMNDNYDSIMAKPHNRNRAEAGRFTVAEFERAVNNIRYENVKEGEYELEYAARAGRLNPQYFPVAQRLYSQMLERTHQTIPQVDISRGRFRGRILRLDDPLHLMAGDITDCCQAIGTHAGEGSMIHSATEKNGSVFVIEEYDEYGNYVNTVAQSWTWRNGDRICFDNVEIPDALEDSYVQAGTHNELFEVYRDAAKMLLDNDKKAMQTLLEKGKITKAQYDILVLKDVTMGTGCDDLVKHLTGDTKKGLRNAKVVLPIEAEKRYDGVQHQKTLWIDSKATQYIVASMDDEERKELNTQGKASINDIPLQYTRTREMIARKGTGIHLDMIKSMRAMKEREQDTTSFMVKENIEEVEEILETIKDTYDIDSINVNLNSNEDWFILSSKTDNGIRILDTSLTTGKFGTEEQASYDAELAKVEYGQAMQKLILEAADLGKNFVCEINESPKHDIFRELAKQGIISLGTDGKISLLDRDSLVGRIDADREKIEKDTAKRNLVDVVKPDETDKKDDSHDKDDGDER